MISFLTEFNEDSLSVQFKEAIEFYRECEDGAVFRFCPVKDALLIRGESEDGYFFPYPEFAEEADKAAVFALLEEYAMTEEIPLIYIDVPVSEVNALCARYRDPAAEAIDEEAEVFGVQVRTELDELDEFPTAQGQSISLTPLTDRDKYLYGRICRNRKLLTYWGYDYRQDKRFASGRYFLKEVQREFAVRSALTLGIRFENRLIGDATFYHFDGKGSAEFSLRILPRFQGQGLGYQTLLLMTEFAKNELRLLRLNAEVRKENLPSVSLMKKCMKERGETENTVLFELGFS